MKYNIVIIASIVLLIITFNTCSENGTSPKEKPDTTSHDYTWVVDTLRANDAVQILMKGIWGADENNVWIIGHSDNTDYQIWHWDGTEWENINPYIYGDSPSYLAIFGFAESDIWIVGDGARRNPIGDGLLHREYILHYDGAKWERHTDIKAPTATAIWGSSSNNLFVGCDSGIVLHYNGTEWQKQFAGNNTQLLDIYSTDDEDIFAAGVLFIEPKNKFFQFNYKDNSWAIVDSFWWTPDANLERFGVYHWGTDINNFYSAGPAWLYKYNGQSWDKILKSVQFKDIYGSSRNNIFAASIFNNVFHFNGNSWKRDVFFDPYRLGSSINIWCNDNNVFITAISLIDNKFTSLNFRGTKTLKGGG